MKNIRFLNLFIAFTYISLVSIDFHQHQGININFINKSFATEANYAAITVAQGRVEVFAEPSSANKASESVLFDGKKYQSIKAKIGSRVFPGQVIKTGSNGKARIIFNNGDQFTVGPDTAYVFPITTAQNEAGEVKLMYGKLRAVIEKDGPRKGLKVITPTAVAGVRGTDFVVGFNPAKEVAEVHVLRGKVEVAQVVAVTQESTSTKSETQSGQTQDSKPKLVTKVIEIETGFKAEITKSEKPKEVEVVRSTQKELIRIQKDSNVKSEEKIVASLTPEVQTEIKTLESKALDTTLNDIKTYTPDVYAKIQQQTQARPDSGQSAVEVLQKAMDIQTVNNIVAQELAKEAPKTKQKPKKGELKSTEENVYDKYYNPDGK